MGQHEDYEAYHDDEWGRPVTGDSALFERICLEGFQAGLSWLTILRKRESFRSAFETFEPSRVAEFDQKKIESLMNNVEIVRNRAKILSTINNAQCALKMIDEYGSLANFLWSFEPSSKMYKNMNSVPSQTDDSKKLSSELKKKGWSFVGPTTIYAFMQAVGMVNDHVTSCWVFEDVEKDRRKLSRPI
ncbi:MAG: DNA-3-methyladenine glycosylase I [Acidimicrobiales bacterium]|nr:DNA-3-methyladenine glycosylase I [Acidimicrobiales bacterium]